MDLEVSTVVHSLAHMDQGLSCNGTNQSCILSTCHSCQGINFEIQIQLDQIHKSHNAPVPYPTTYQSEQKYTHFYTDWSIVGYGTVALWDLFDWSNVWVGRKVTGHISDILGTCLTAHTSSLTHWGRATHICVSKLTIIGSDNGLSPSRRQPIIWTNWTLWNKIQWNFNRNPYIFIQENAFENVIW